jgi:hypothetical protein
MNDIRVYSIKTNEKKFSHDYYCQIVTHEVCDVALPTNYNQPLYLLTFYPFLAKVLPLGKLLFVLAKPFYSIVKYLLINETFIYSWLNLSFLN